MLAEIVYTDASTLPIYGQVCGEGIGTYTRLPYSLKETTREPVWYLGQHSAGLYVRFRTNSSAIWCRWTSTFQSSMNHMAACGTRGLDLYILSDGSWRFAGTGKPQLQIKETTDVMIEGLDGTMHECMMYLSLYDGVDKLEIGVDEGSTIEASDLDSPAAEKPVIVYGTSITQGGCVSRPGMCYTSILSRKLDRQFINLGFSGNGIIDYEIAELMAAYPDPGAFVLDYVGNAKASIINEKGEKFFRILRDAHPDVPIIFLGAKKYPHTAFSATIRATVEENDAAQKALYLKLRKQGEKNIYYSPASDMTGDESCEQTVDKIHFTDNGVANFTKFLLPVFKKALK